jgi:hypothetical protein
MLGEDNHQDVRSLAVKADKLQALYGHLQHGTVAAVDSTDSAVNAVKGSSRGGKSGYGHGRGRGGSKPQRGGGHSGAGQSADGAASTAAAAGLSPVALAQDSAGLLSRRGRLNAIAPSKLVHIKEQLSERRFLVGMGAAYNIFPHHSSDPPTGPHLTGPSSQHIGCWG